MSKAYSRDGRGAGDQEGAGRGEGVRDGDRRSSPDDVASLLERAAQEQGVEMTLRMAPKGVLISHAEHVAAV